MIATLRGTLLEKNAEKIILESGGVGYEVFVTASSIAQLPGVGQSALLYIYESFGMYGGGQTLYGFSTPAEKSLFVVFKDNVPSTGAKKALEYLEKASKSLPDFRRAILEKDARLLSGVFGFTRKTADRLIDALKDKLDRVPHHGPERLRPMTGAMALSSLSQALNALSALGYKPAEARLALQAVTEENPAEELKVEQILRLALKKL